MGYAEFRVDLICRLATEPTVARAAAHGATDRLFELAEQFGVREEILSAALGMAREGQGRPPTGVGGPQLITFNASVPAPLRAAVLGFCATLRAGHNQVLRMLLHARMRHQDEPTPRARGHWGPLPGCEQTRARYHALGAALPDARAGKINLTVALSAGLTEAVKRRALAYQTTPQNYATLWLADAVDGKLDQALIQPIEIRQMFDVASAYVLPAFSIPSLPPAKDPSP